MEITAIRRKGDETDDLAVFTPMRSVDLDDLHQVEDQAILREQLIDALQDEANDLCERAGFLMSRQQAAQS